MEEVPRVLAHTKFMIFVIIWSLLVATIYSSSTQFVFAEFLPKVTDKGAYPLGEDCTKSLTYGTYSCTQDEDQDNKDDGLSAKPDSNNSNDNNDNDR